MTEREKLLALKKERTTLRVVGACLIPVGYLILGICFAVGSSLGILGMFVAVAGIVMVVRSFVHIKFKGLNQALANPSGTNVAYRNTANPEYLEDMTFIRQIRSTPLGNWRQYDILLAARGYGWDMMRNWADYVASADLEMISQVTTGALGAEETDVTQSYRQSGRKCENTKELERENGMLSIAGLSKTLGAPVKIVWVNQTNTLRLFTTEKSNLRVSCYVETMVRRTFGTKDAMKLGKPIPPAEEPKKEPPVEPVVLKGTQICINGKAFSLWKIKNPSAMQYEFRGFIPLGEKNPVLQLIDDGEVTREYRLETEGDEDFTGKYFAISVRLGNIGEDRVPVAQIDGFVCDKPEERAMTMDDVGYRMEGYFLACGSLMGADYYAKSRGQDLPMKALKYPGYTTPSNVRLIGICPDCGKSFAFRGYAFYMAQNDVAYSDDGLDCCQIQAYDIDKNTWTYEEDGKTFRYYNSFCCPHCGTPYIDYKKYPQNKTFGVSGCVLLGRKAYSAN